ncbi:MAG: dephospho-CoA kinase [Acidimicrobiales bacterium]|jgi:dephospho-CoA kinase|nr:dephospho-CoA kinase [Acidimicrobiales bacterium]MDP6298923.1 dephospho-CoA kinase [Acidimicrobiales bacterium]HJM27882.1 dephospho-CoA kinase [Acidimicrobiales bacterium]HJM98441.1 dephospho-CoA kinase [Acidimicrobiales bacterium]
MPEFAITGGIGSGKTTVAKMLVAKGAALIDADQIVHDLQNPGQKVYESIVECFGQKVLLEDGGLDRQKIADLVFSDPKELEALNKIVHPAVGKEMAALREKYASEGRIVLIDIPLLINSEGELSREEYEFLKGKIVVDCEPEIAISRLITYRSFKEADARARIDKQATRDQRNKHADFMINNNGHEESLNEQVEACWGWMQSLVKGKSNQ